MIRAVKKITINNYNKIVSRNLFDYKDPFLLEKQLTDDEKSIKDLAHNFSKDNLLPNVVQSFRNEKFDKNIMKEMGNVGLLGPTINGYGCAGVNYVSYGLIMREIERIDSAQAKSNGSGLFRVIY